MVRTDARATSPCRRVSALNTVCEFGSPAPQQDGRTSKVIWLATALEPFRLDVGYGGKTGRYFCPRTTEGTERCISLGVSVPRCVTLALQQARYETAHARRQYDAVDPDNRLVAGELERRWNEALQVVHRIEGELAALEARKPPSLGEWERMSSKCWHQHCARVTSSSWTICALTRSRGCGKRSKPPEQRCAICLSTLQISIP